MTLSVMGMSSLVIVTPGASFTSTRLGATVMVPMRAGPSPSGNTMSLSLPVPNVFTPGFIGKRPASVSQPLSLRSRASDCARHSSTLFT